MVERPHCRQANRAWRPLVMSSGSSRSNASGAHECVNVCMCACVCMRVTCSCSRLASANARAAAHVGGVHAGAGAGARASTSVGATQCGAARWVQQDAC
eukprot:6985137-Alexandrium_andersonii.AAC.1